MLSLTLALLAATAAGGEPAARVGARAVTWSEVEYQLKRARAAGTPSDPAAVLEALVDRAALAQEGERLGLERSPEVVARVDAARRRAAAERFLEEEVYPSARPDDATLRAMYHDGADSVRLQMLVLASREKAEAAAARLRGGASFRDEARDSLDPDSAARGGELGLKNRGALQPAVAEAAFRAPVGEVAGPIQLELGWAVVRVQERTVADEKGFEERRQQLARFAESALRASARRHLVEMLSRQARARVDEGFLDSLGPRLDFTPRELERVLATVGSRRLKLADILPDVLSLSRGKAGGHYSGPSVKLEVARHHLEWMVLEEEAVRRGHARKVPAERVAPARDEALADADAARLRAGVPSPTEAEVEAAYRERKAELTRPGWRSCSHILLADEKEAAEVRKQLAGGAAFEAVARHRSRDASTAERGGLLGDIGDDRLRQLMTTEPAFAAAIQITPPGEVSAAARSRLGWHLVRCQPPVAARTAPLAEVREPLRRRLAAERGEAALRSRLADLRRELGVRIDRDGLARLGPAPAPPAQTQTRSSP